MILTFLVNIRPAMHSCLRPLFEDLGLKPFLKNEKNHMIRSRWPRLFSKRLNYPECQSSARLSDVNSVSKKTYAHTCLGTYTVVLKSRRHFVP